MGFCNIIDQWFGTENQQSSAVGLERTANESLKTEKWGRPTVEADEQKACRKRPT